jgi:hypothetical protein
LHFCPRISTYKIVPTAENAGGTYASAIFFPSVGDGEPLVTTPMASPFSLQQQYWSRAMPRSIISIPTSVRFNPAALAFSSAERPTKSPFSILQ